MFPNVKDDEVDSIGFLILTEIMGISYQEMGQLADILVGRNDHKELKDAIVDVSIMVENALKPYIESPAKGGKGSLACHAEYQIASYIITIFKLKYDFDTDGRLKANDKNKKDIKSIEQYLYKHYLYDILRGFWAGSGDSKLEQIISDPTTCRYTRDVAYNDFEAVITMWLDENNSKTRLAYVSTEAKLFLNYLLRTRKFNISGISYDVEHCVPKAIIKQYYNQKDITVPMSSVYNLIYIPHYDNRSKGESTYYEKKEKSPNTYTLNQEQLDDYVYPRKNELSFLDSTDTITEEAYYSFLNNRRQILRKTIMERLYKNS